MPHRDDTLPAAYPGIPTDYAGCHFRSRLEAKWAAFFDAVHWEWEYEPVDFKGWIPDFALIGEKQITYVEVKPVFVFPRDVAAEIEKSGCRDEVLIIGAGNPVRAQGWPMGCGPGWLADQWFCGEDYGPPTWNWDAAVYGINGDGLLDFFHSTMSYGYRISGEHDGDHHICMPHDLDIEITNTWRASANRVQWYPKYGGR